MDRKCLAAAAAFWVLTAMPALAQPFPSKPIRMVLAYAAGGPTDFLARTIGEKVSARVGQPVLVEARPGANERVATEHVLRSPADGYTVLLVAPPHATNPSLFQMNYDAQKDLSGLIHLINIPPLITTHPASGLHSFNDLVKAAKAKPGELTFGTPGNATSNHLLMELLGLIADSERSTLLPEVPTLYEQGFPDAVVTTWFGLVIHAQTPRDIIHRLNAAFDAALHTPEVREKIGAVGMVPVGGSAEQFTAHIRAEAERWGRVVKTRGIRAE